MPGVRGVLVGFFLWARYPCRCGEANSGYRQEAARLLPTVTASEEKNVSVNLNCQTLLDFTTTTTLCQLGQGEPTSE